MKRFLSTYSPYLLLTAAIMLPLLRPGYILTLDLVFTPHLRAPASLSNDWLWQNLLHYLNFVAPSQLIEKCVLLSIPLLAGIGMHRLVAYIKPSGKQPELSWYWATYVAGLFYAANPFTYSRFMAGQYAVLLGYALLPFFVRQLLVFIDRPVRRNMLTVTSLGLLISIISIHTLGEAVLVTVTLLGLACWRSRNDRALQKRLVGLGLLGVSIFVVLSSYWLLPLALGKGSTAQTIRQFDHADTAAFATTGSNPLAQLGNVLKLQGFWADTHDLYLLPQDQLVGWGTLRLIIWTLVAWGAVMAWRSRRGLMAAFLVIAICSCIAAIGIPGTVLTALGYREPQKFAGLLALLFAIFIAFGCARLLWLAKNRSETVHSLAASGLMVLVIVFTPTMYWGFSGQLQSSNYPPDWYAANEWLNNDTTGFRAVALPWHQYMSYRFAGRIIGNPAQDFFDKPVISSNNPELGRIGQPQNDHVRADISTILSRHDKRLSQQLARHNVKYLLLAKDYDYRTYRYLDRQPGITAVWDSPSLKIYRNLSQGRTE
jgi:hypothetical protein